MSTRFFDALLNDEWAMRQVDAERYYGVVQQILARRADGETFDFKTLQTSDDERRYFAPMAQVPSNVAEIHVVGPLFRYANMMTEMSGATSMEVLRGEFAAALANPAVEGIVLHIDSPGGQADGTGILADEIFAARGQKPIVSFVSGMGASAAYWIAAAADEIFLEEMADVGSVGAMTVVRSPQAGLREGQVRFISSQSPYKVPDVETDEGAQQVQEWVNACAQIFIDKVAVYRNTTAEKVESDFGQGWIKTGHAAVAAGMADGVATYQQILDALSEEGKRRAPKNKSQMAVNAGGVNSMGLMDILAGRSGESKTEESSAAAATVSVNVADLDEVKAQLDTAAQQVSEATQREAQALAREAEAKAELKRHAEAAATAFADGIVAGVAPADREAAHAAVKSLFLAGHGDDVKVLMGARSTESLTGGVLSATDLQGAEAVANAGDQTIAATVDKALEGKYAKPATG